jgi:hypothetical protein
MVGMVLSGASRYSTLSVNRTFVSGGSLGGNKKAGTVQQGNWTRIAPGMMNRSRQTTPSVLATLAFTTRNPFQYNRNGYYRGVLG